MSFQQHSNVEPPVIPQNSAETRGVRQVCAEHCTLSPVCQIFEECWRYCSVCCYNLLELR